MLFRSFKSGQKEKKVNDVEKGMNCTITGDKTIQKKTSMNTVQEGKRTTSEQSRQMISSKQVAKIMKRGEPVFLALICPTSKSGQGMTQKVKQQIMKETGPIRKAPPVAEKRANACATRHPRMCGRNYMTY